VTCFKMHQNLRSVYLYSVCDEGGLKYDDNALNVSPYNALPSFSEDNKFLRSLFVLRIPP